MESYDVFSQFYDVLTTDVDYCKRTEYLKSLFFKFDRSPSLLLDLACGTGGFSIEFSKSGAEVIGIDPSEGMLSVARKKCEENGCNVLLLCQKAEDLELYGTVDGAICCLDSINHITDYDELVRSLAKVSLFLEKDRLFIFDVNTQYKHKNILADNTFVFETDDVYLVWQNEYSDVGMVDIYLDFFETSDGTNYRRHFEHFCERAYLHEELLSALNQAGLELITVFDDMSFEEPKIDSERIVYITKKR